MSHWLVRVVQSAGLPSADSLEIAPDASVADAWATAETTLGIDAWELAAVVAPWFRLQVADLESADRVATKLLPASVVRAYNVFPVSVDDRRLTVATSDPIDVQAEQQIGFASGRPIAFEIAPPRAIASAVEAHYAPDRAVADMLDRIEPGSQSAVTILEEIEEEDQGDGLAVTDQATDDGPIVRLTNMILEDAVQKGSSDIHLQPFSKGGVIRLRIDGVLQSGITVPLAVLAQVISRVKIMSRLDISDRMRPQDGRSRMRIGDRRYDLRVSTVPARGGEKAVIRILDPTQSRQLDESGIAEGEVVRIRQALRNRDGILVITGPTGSGKTTTMYAVLQEISSSDVNIMTVEDPVEYELPGLTQIQVDAKKGVTFESALRAILRQDPDVIFVGEIRDQSTAEMAVQASLTGHLVLTTVHANDAVGSVRRFLDLGLDSGTVSETLRASLAQRLLRTLCSRCSAPAGDQLTAEEEGHAERFGVRPVREAAGCDYCSGTGYRGRAPVVEILSPSAELLHMVAQGASHLELTKQARSDGMRTLVEGGLDLVAEGRTTLTEMVRVLGDEVLAAAPTDALDVLEAVEAGPPPASEPPPTALPQPQSTPEAEPEPEPGLELELELEPEPEPGLELELEPEPVALPGDQPTEPHLEPWAEPWETLPGGSTGSREPSLAAAPGEEEEIRVLVVDDDEDTRLLARSVLQGRGWSVDEAANGKEALLKIGAPGLALVVLDLGLPDIGGMEILETLKSNLQTAGVPVVVLTGHGSRETERAALVAGAEDYIAKPLDPMIFLSRCRAVVRRQTA